MNRSQAMKTFVWGASFIATSALANEQCRNWNWQAGQRRTAQFTAQADICVGARRTDQVVNQVRAAGDTAGYLFDKRIPLVRAEAQTLAPAPQNLDLSLGLFVAGQKIWGPQTSVNAPSIEQSYQLPAFDQEFPYTVQLGPIGVTVAAGVRGAGGVKAQASANFAQLQAAVQPQIDSSGYAYADLNLWLARVGAEGNLLFARGQIDLGASTQLELRGNSSVLIAGVKGTANLQTLQGGLSVYADAGSKRRNRGSHSWERQLVGFDGYRLEGATFSYMLPELTIY